jgi:hypothetical protein
MERLWAALRWLFTAVSHIGPLRVPIAAGLILLYLPLAAISPALPGAALIRGLFDLRALTPTQDLAEWTARTAVTFFAAFLAIALAILATYQTAAMIHDLAPARFGSPPAARRWLGFRGYVPRILFAIPAALAMIASLQASLDGLFPKRRQVLIAAGVALIVVLGLVEIAVWFFGTHRPSEWRIYRWLRDRASAVNPRGYVTTPEAPSDVDPYPHHVWASLFLFLSVGVWLAVALWAQLPSIQPSFRVPALCSLYVLLMLATWLLSSATFFFDFYRVPILMLFGVFVFAIGLQGYAYRVLPANQAHPLPPAEVVKARIGHPAGRIVAISASGGGIQAAAWTARVLQGLVEEAESQGTDKFLQRIAVVSGVSGGSVGLAPFILALDARKVRLLDSELRRAASASSLDPVAATHATTDPFLDIFPFPRRWFTDRGLALQNAWGASWEGIGLPATKPLSALANPLRVPAIMFNATSMTTGERLIFGTTVPTPPPSSSDVSFLQSAVIDRVTKLPEYKPVTVVPDIDIATAARLSATFPLVSPAAHCAECKDIQYVVDGGYIDNSGIESLAEWLEALLSDDEMRGVGVSVVQIVPFKEDADCPPMHDVDRPPSQAAVPLRTMYGIRGPGQARRSIDAIADLQREFSANRVCVHSFAYHECHDRHGFNPPLSWHLTDGQSQQVRRSWDNKDIVEAQKVVKEALNDIPCIPPLVQPSRASAKQDIQQLRYKIPPRSSIKF